VFVVGYLGDWRRAAAVLFERESLSGNPPPSREEGEKVAPATEAGAGERGAISYGIRAANTGSNGWGIQEELTHTLDTSAPHAVAHPCNEVAPAVTTGPPFSRTGNERVECEAIVPTSRHSVRRLTPTECERLQGFPDGFTQIPWRNKEPEKCPDGPRYKALGNSFAVPVVRWLGERIQQVEEITNGKS
jgi:DNA (cytosine-5)-methyltransferase 1